MNLADGKNLLKDDIECNIYEAMEIAQLMSLLSLTNSAYLSSSNCSKSKVQALDYFAKCVQT